MVSVFHNSPVRRRWRSSAQHLDETEFIEVVELPLDELRQRLRTGELWNTDTIYMGLDYLNLL